MARQPSTGIHAGRPSPNTAMLGAAQGDPESKAKSRIKSAKHVVLLTLLYAFAFDLGSPCAAPSIAGHGGQAPQGARQEPKPFRRARDGPSKSPAMAEERRASGRASASREPTQSRGRAFFGYFLCTSKESDPRSSAEPRVNRWEPMVSVHQCIGVFVRGAHATSLVITALLAIDLTCGQSRAD